jgi:UrcA family protein
MRHPWLILAPSMLSIAPNTHLEIDMNTNSPVRSAKSFICIAAVAACAVLSGPVQSRDHETTVAFRVSAAGLDLSRPADARELYARIQHAADIVCTHGMRVDLEPVHDYVGCYEKSLGDAVRSVKQPQLSIVYLATHTPGQAAAYGIEIPARMAAK